MKMRKITAALATGALLAGPLAASATDLPACQGELAETVNSYNSAWARAVATGEPEAIEGLYSDDAVLMPPTDTTLVGAAPISSYFIDASRAFELTRYSVDLVSCEMGDDAIYLAGVWGAKQRTFGGETVNVTGNVMRVLERGPGGDWQSAYEIWN